MLQYHGMGPAIDNHGNRMWIEEANENRQYHKATRRGIQVAEEVLREELGEESVN